MIDLCNDLQFKIKYKNKLSLMRREVEGKQTENDLMSYIINKYKINLDDYMKQRKQKKEQE